MPKNGYAWQAVDQNGKILKGISDFQDISQTRSWLRKQGYYPLVIRSYKNYLSLYHSLKSSQYEWIRFARNISMLLEAGIPLLNALDMIKENVVNKLQKKRWDDVRDRIKAGEDFSEALSGISPPPNLFILSLIKAGEKSGTLVESLNEAADELEQEQIFSRKIWHALAYPLLLLIAVVFVLFILGIWIIPMYQNLLAGLNQDLPYLTKFIFDLGKYSPLYLGLFFGALAFTLVYLRLKYPVNWQRKLEEKAGTLPLTGTLLRLLDLRQFCRISGSLIHAGFPLLEVLQLSLETLRTKQMKELINRSIHGVGQGRSLSTILCEGNLFPKYACTMIVMAEESGKLDLMFTHLAKFFRVELEQKFENIARMLGPSLILGMALLIGFVAVGVLLPIFNATTYIQ